MQEEDRKNHGDHLEYTEDSFESNHSNIRSAFFHQNGHHKSRDTAVQMCNALISSHVIYGGYFPTQKGW